MFWFKRKKVVVDVLTYSAALYERYRIVKANEFIPDWWKKIKPLEREYQPGLFHESQTMKGCMGFIDLYKKGFIVPLWNDLILQTKEDGSYSYQFAKEGVLGSHGNDQHQNMDWNGYFNIKIEFPCILYSKSDIQYHYGPATWNYGSMLGKFVGLNGVIDFKYNNSINYNTFFPLKAERYEFKAGMPLTHLIPLTEKNVEFKYHLLTETEYVERSKHFNSGSNFMSGALRRRSDLEKNKSKCPFHLG